MTHQPFSRKSPNGGDRRFLKGERGTYLVEFAIVAPVFFLLMFGIMEFGRAVWSYSSVSHAAREGVRYAIVRGSESGRTATSSEIETYVRERAGLSSVQVTTTWKPDDPIDPTDLYGDQPGSWVQVKVDYDFQPSVPLFPAMALTSTSRMMISF